MVFAGCGRTDRLGQGRRVLRAAEADVGIMLGGIAFRPKGGPDPIGTVDIRPAPLHLRGALVRTARIAGRIRRVELFVVPVGHPFIEIAGQIVDAIGAAPLVTIADGRHRLSPFRQPKDRVGYSSYLKDQIRTELKSSGDPVTQITVLQGAIREL